MDKSRIRDQVKGHLLKPAYFYNTNFSYVNRLAFGSSRGALNVATRDLDPASVTSWEFSAFSQNGEDGIIEHLASLIREPNRYFVEIGASDGLENNSSYLAFVKKYNGLMVEGSSFKSRNAERFLQPLNWGVQYSNMFVSRDNVSEVAEESLLQDPDFFSLDIDGVDFHIAKGLLGREFRPKIACVEYNSAFGPDRLITVPYRDEFDYREAHASRLYYGVSLAGWLHFFNRIGYEFVSVDSNGVNAFFIDPGPIDPAFLNDLRKIEWAENYAQRARLKRGWTEQFEMVKDMPYFEID